MNKSKKIIMLLLFTCIVCTALSGCSLQDRIEEYSSDKEQCYLDTENVTQFSYRGSDYTILADTVSNGGLGEWIGYIRQLVVIDENGGYHKAIISENIKDSDTVFDFKATEQSINGSFEVNPENATQLLCGGTVYQVTSDTVSDDELGSYIDILAKSVTFDKETKIPLSREDLSDIDWYGENAGQEREQWFYTDIYEIYRTDTAEAVAVKINNQYYIAKRQ